MRKRLFVAINFDSSIKLGLSQIIQGLPRHPNLKKTATGNLHLTLIFLGDTDEELIPDVQSVLKSIAQKHSPLRISFAETGAFPNLDHPRVFWIGLKSPGLRELQQDIAQGIQMLLPSQDTQPFKLHVTLARIKEPLPREVTQKLRDLKLTPPSPTIISSIDLMASELTPAGPIYQIISAHRLQNNPTVSSPSSKPLS